MSLLASEAKVLVIGNGGAVSAICRELLADGVSKIYCIPGNPGTALMGCQNVAINLVDDCSIATFAAVEEVDFTIIGSNDFSAEDIMQTFTLNGLPIIGPSAFARELNDSRLAVRNFIKSCHLLQPKFFGCRSRLVSEKAKKRLGFPLALKVDKASAGAGIFYCDDESDWQEAMKEIFDLKKFGQTRVLVEEWLEGEEISIVIACDENWHSYQTIGIAQNYRFLLDDNMGPITGGMGAVSPVDVGASIIEQGEELIDGIPMMLDNPGIYTIRVMVVNNKLYFMSCRSGFPDPETQVILPLLDSSLYEILYRTAFNELDQIKTIEHHASYAVVIVKVAEGYPGDYVSGEAIHNLSVDDPHAAGYILQAGTVFKGPTIVSAAGRVLNLVSVGNSLKEAIKNAYKLCTPCHFLHEFYRADIGSGTETRNF